MFVETNQYVPVEVKGSLNDSLVAQTVCEGVYAFMDKHRIREISTESKIQFSSCIALFPEETITSQEDAMKKLCLLLKHMHEYDVQKGYSWAPGISKDPKNPLFSFSLVGEAFFIPFFHEKTHSPARRSEI